MTLLAQTVSPKQYYQTNNQSIISRQYHSDDSDEEEEEETDEMNQTVVEAGRVNQVKLVDSQVQYNTKQ